MIGDFLYRLTPADESAGAAIASFIRRINDTQSATQVNADLQLPANVWLEVDNIVGFGIAGAGQITDSLTLIIQDPEGNLLVRIGRVDEGVQNSSVTLKGPLLVPPRHIIRCNGNFDAAVAANFTEVNVVGRLIPRGNIQFS